MICDEYFCGFLRAFSVGEPVEPNYGTAVQFIWSVRRVHRPDRGKAKKAGTTSLDDSRFQTILCSMERLHHSASRHRRSGRLLLRNVNDATLGGKEHSGD